VRDGISVAKLGIPAVALVTENFLPQGDFVAASLGMPEVPRIRIPHPIAGTGVQYMREVAEQITPLILNALEKPQ
jgi:hypothetical protein